MLKKSEFLIQSAESGVSPFRFAFILVGRKLKVGSAEQLLFVAV